MAEQLLSVGIDVGTTTTQMVVSRLWVENRGSAFSVPEMVIGNREIRYRSPVYFTPLIGKDRVDGEEIRQIITREYERAGIHREAVDTGAIIITGETSRRENARAVLDALSGFAGDFVVATAGPDLESVLAAKGAGAVDLSERTGKTVLHMDIGGGTSNLALIRDGKIVRTGCLNVGGRLLKFDKNGVITYISPVLQGYFSGKVGDKPSVPMLEKLADVLVAALQMAAGLQQPTDMLSHFLTAEAGKTWEIPAERVTLSFSGGVADCIETKHAPFDFGDMGPILGRTIKNSSLCAGKYRLGAETIRATVIGAGCHSAQLSGSTVFYQNMEFPLKNLPVVHKIEDLACLDGPGVLALPGISAAHYGQIRQLADEIAARWPTQSIWIALEADMAKALGHALALRFPADRPILCIDRVKLEENSYLDVGVPLSSAIPVIVKTLILNR